MNTMDDVLAIILGGGRGTRLFPLTLKRSKPAVPIGGKYRLVDIPISNCLNAGLRQIFVLTQFNSESLNRHVALTYKFDVFSSGFVTVLAAEQTDEGGTWFQGTADAVRQCLRHMRRSSARDMLILSGDQLYSMDYVQMLRTHRESGADATVAVIPVAEDQTSAFGILKMDNTGRIVHFDEKPPKDRLPALVSELPGGNERGYLASMGIYIFRREVLESAVENPKLVDFGRHVIPDAVPRQRVQAYVYRGYWEDVGTIQSYFQANLALCDAIPPFDFYNSKNPVYTNPRFLPGLEAGGVRHPQRPHLRGVHHAWRHRRARGHRNPQSHRREGADPQQPAHRCGRLRDHRGDARQRVARDAGGRGRRGHRHRERDRRQERAHRTRGSDHEQGRSQGARRRRLLHP